MESVDVSSMYIRVDELITELYNEGQIQELNVQALQSGDSHLVSVIPTLCNQWSDLFSDDDSASTLDMSKFAFSESTITVDTAELACISIKASGNDIMGYTNKVHEVDIVSPVDLFGLLD